ncbi:hypothetical protein Ga0102493_111672 [Erythrobacter litoralis]|jgi:uncharacterized protein (TIGR02118 family)|uniref:EthD domain-containing protein n=1 Tax=Erythrobacter litoralis TaxID=39960 RepID=A0A074MDL2_9SPHN|nr:EthD domain-containing protein [Erythrobacter litoralis]AOL22696.1 hypothetical protein Ga0102493_111672 [Erythrobacter litoralis]KEO89938.1 hypothetical protein EH32_02825 [Erythrobacter litoralis]MEE4338254.1 EthD domain-containing protein [Erythrobacter sp.]
MIRITYCLHRLPALTREEFQRYWRGTHAPLVAAASEALGIRRYVQQHTLTSDMARRFASAQGIPCGEGEDYDGVAEIWFDSEEALARVGESEEGRRHAAILAADEARFIHFERSRYFFSAASEVIV